MKKNFLHPFVIALAVYLAINGALIIGSRGLSFSGAGQDKSAVAVACRSAVEQYESLKQAPQIVLVGSSLMMAANWTADAKNYGTIADVYHHHKSLSLTRDLRKLGVANPNAFSFALPGAMASDVFLLNYKLFKDDKAPNTIVYGVGPRDFMDDLLTGETRTAVFREMSDLSDLWQLGDLYMSSPQEKIDFALNNGFFLYGKRWRYQKNMESVANRIYSKVLASPAAANASAANNNDLAFLINQNRQEVWSKSIDEYRARYRHFNESQFAKQMAFLHAFIETAQKRNVNVVLLNMPLSQDNLKLMPPGFYDSYISALNSMSKQYNINVVDMNKDGSYPDSCFYDTAHLNADGGVKVVDYLAQWIVEHPTQNIAAAKSEKAL